ncbi:U2 snRNP-associated SURP domain-containing protein [Gaertneriomyces sp. JEL0708]|nr:U2 snRNP-associated SURP domain-containing protein [Gaertneriomyces sp. JEL0708]
MADRADKLKFPWGIDKPKPSKQITSAKLNTFNVGINRKTQFQKQKEEAEQRKKEEEEEAAKVYAEFVASFDDDDTRPKGWVKGGTIVPTVLYEPGSERSQPADPPAKALYKPMPFVKAGASVTPLKPPRLPSPELEVKPTRPKGKRNLDEFLEELKRGQEEREQRIGSKQARLGDSRSHSNGSLTLKAAFEDNAGSHDTGDPNTTNLYVGNLSPQVTEEILCREFAVHGPIASVKIMWPRTPEEHDRGRNCGFISFMARAAAESALEEMNGKVILGHDLRVGWGRAVPIPPQPVFALPSHTKQERSGLPFNAQVVKLNGGVGAIPPPNAGGGRSRARHEVHVQEPSDRQVRMIIHRMIERVIRFGPAFESLIMEREVDNPSYKFLFDNDSPEHVYYRWKLYSILQGDPTTKWYTEPFQMFTEGATWIPPEPPFDDEVGDDAGYLSSTTEESVDSDPETSKPRHSGPKGTLLKRYRMRLEHMLRNITMERGAIGRVMVFALKHADAADEIIDIITKSLLIQATPLFPTKMARLFAVSDILHNSGAPIQNAWKYRNGFERRLEEIFSHLGSVRRSIGARLRQEQVRKHIMNLLAVWDAWIIFPQEFTDKLRAAFSEEEKGKNGEEGLQSRLQAQKDQKTGVYALDEGGVRELEHAAQKTNKWARIDESAATTANTSTTEDSFDIDQEVQRFMDELASAGVDFATRKRKADELRARLNQEFADQMRV